jgi:hypothetical protein
MTKEPSPNPVERPPVTGSTSNPVAPSAKDLQRRVDQAATFNLFSLADTTAREVALRDAKSLIGINVHEVLHRFDVKTHAPNANRPLCASNAVGEPVGRFSQRWMIIPDDFIAAPDRAPPPTPLDPTRSQRFVMLDGFCRFGDGADGFRGFGTGQTMPSTSNGRPQTIAIAVGTLFEGFGKFAGHENATYVYCGTLAAHRGFTGNMMLRVMDPQQTLSTDTPLPSVQKRADQDTGFTYIVLRGEAVPSDPVTPYVGPDGKQIGLIVQQGLKLQHIDSTARGQEGIRAKDSVGQSIGRITAYVTFNPALASGTALDPVPFTAYDEFVFWDREGKTIGSFVADSSDGRVFNITVSGQQGIRFGGVGRIRSGAGPYDGIDGLMTDNSVVIFSPHVSASVYVLRIHDPRGRFRSALGGS